MYQNFKIILTLFSIEQQDIVTTFITTEHFELIPTVTEIYTVIKGIVTQINLA